MKSIAMRIAVGMFRALMPLVFGVALCLGAAGAVVHADAATVESVGMEQKDFGVIEEVNFLNWTVFAFKKKLQAGGFDSCSVHLREYDRPYVIFMRGVNWKYGVVMNTPGMTLVGGEKYLIIYSIDGAPFLRAWAHAIGEDSISIQFSGLDAPYFDGFRNVRAFTVSIKDKTFIYRVNNGHEAISRLDKCYDKWSSHAQ